MKQLLTNESQITEALLKEICQSVGNTLTENKWNFGKIFQNIVIGEAVIATPLLVYHALSMQEEKLFDDPAKHAKLISIFVIETAIMMGAIIPVAAKGIAYARSFWTQKEEPLRADTQLPTQYKTKIEGYLKKLRGDDMEAGYPERIETYGELAEVAEILLHNFQKAQIEIPYLHRVTHTK
jgi:hypothetical protein